VVDFSTFSNGIQQPVITTSGVDNQLMLIQI